MNPRRSFKVAAVSAAPVFMDRDATVEKACGLIAEAAGQGAELIVFPETFIPTYPMWVWEIPASEGGLLGELQAELVEQSVEIPGPATDRLCEAARDAGVHIVMGVNEPVTDTSGSSLYNTTVYIGAAGEVLGRHRKLVPTAPERLVWTPGDGSTLEVFDTPLGKIGGLICWENYMPLARMAMYGKGVEIYLAPTADARGRWQSTLQHISLEGRCFVLGCNQYVTRDMYPDDLEIRDELEAWPETLCRGGSAIYDPAGECLAGPLFDEDGMLIAELDMSAVARAKFDFDVVGHYARPDVFRLEVDEDPKPPVSY